MLPEFHQTHKVDVALRDMGGGHCGDGLMVGFGDFTCLFQP